MATKQENPKKSWRINKSGLLGVSVKIRNELNDVQESSTLAEILNKYFIKPTKNHIMMIIRKR
jgi:hypothetical protein